MTKMLAVNSNNDLYLDEQGNIAVNEDLMAVMQACEHAAKAQFREMVLNYDQGIANFQTIWRDAANVLQYEAYLRRALSSVQGVIEIKDLDIVVRENTVFYSATIKTIYGEAALNV